MSNQSEADQQMPSSGPQQANSREAETRFRNMADHAPVMMWVTEPDGYCSYLNKRWYEFTGQTEEEALGLGWTAATHPNDQKLAEETFLAAVAVQGPFRVEYRLRRADGLYRWALDAAAPRFADDGSFLGHVGSVIDIDERREAEDRLALNEERLRLALEVAEIGQWHVDTDTGIMFWPPRVKAMFGISPDVPVTLADYSKGVHPDDREKTLAAYEAASDPRHRPLYDVEYRTIGKEDGVVRWVAAKGRGLFDAESNCYRMIGTAVDITSRKADELRLRELNESLEAQVAERTADRNRMWLLSTDLMLVTRFDATVTAVNPAWTTLLGWAESELVGRRFIDLVHPEDIATTLHEVEKLSKGRTTMRFENRYRRKDGTYHWLSWTAVPGEGLIHAVARDISGEKEQAEALKLAEDALRQAQKMEAIGQLTGGVAHDFNNLLTVIRGSVDLLRRPNLTAERRDRYIAAIGDTADRAAKLTGQLLAFARRQALMPELFDVGPSILDVATMVRTLAGGRIELELKSPKEPLLVKADRSQFDTAIVNLAINARDAMNSEGVLTIALGAVSGLPARRAHKAVAGDFVAVAVTDQGTGIAQENLNRIFEPFFTTKGAGHGTGLGLSQIIGFAKQSGGDIRVESEFGKGSTFTLYLPRMLTDTGTQDEPLAEENIDGSGICVLIVEDNADVGDFATSALQDLGYASVLARDAEKALAELEKDAEKFNVLFTDVVMPGVSGVELAERVRRHYPDLPVILTSGYSHVLAEHGAHGFELLHKPYSLEQLSRVLHKAIRWKATNSKT